MRRLSAASTALRGACATQVAIPMGFPGNRLDTDGHSINDKAMKDFRDLDVLHAAHDLVVEFHDISQSFPNDDSFGVTSAITRASLAIPRSIANGCGRGSDAALGKAMERAAGFTSELEYLVLLAGEIGLIDEETLEEIALTLDDFKKRLSEELAEL
jgi:four helix bundle protein